MPATDTTGRANQRRRTRKDLLLAAGRLLRQGRKPSMEEIAGEAMVSRATAYRYFPSLTGLLVEAPLDAAMPDPAELFADPALTDPADRLDRAEAALHAMCYANETSLRLMLAHSMEEALSPDRPAGAPLRQNRRGELIDAAHAPARRRLTKKNYARLAAALSLIFGTESMIVFRDVLPLSPAEARRVKSWALRALLAAALDPSKPA